MSRFQLATLASGLAIVILGGLLLLAAEATIEVGSGWLAAAVAGLGGSALVASGIGAREP